MLALGALAYVTDGADVLLLKTLLVVENRDLIGLNDELDAGHRTTLSRVVVVVRVLNQLQHEVGVLTARDQGIVRDLMLGDDALLYIAYVMLIWAAPIPANRWHCSL